MKYCSYRLDWGSFRNGRFYRTDLVIDGQMDIPNDNAKHLNWNEICNFGNNFESAWNVLIALLDNSNKVTVYFGSRGFRTVEELSKKHDDYKEFYEKEVCVQ